MTNDKVILMKVFVHTRYILDGSSSWSWLYFNLYVRMLHIMLQKDSMVIRILLPVIKNRCNWRVVS